MFQRTLLCTDLADGIHRFAQCLPQLHSLGLQQFTFFHCAPFLEEVNIPRPDTAAVEAAQAKLRSLVPPEFADRTTLDVQCGKTDTLLLEAIQRHQPDLVILGSSVKSLLTQRLFGSTLATLTQRISVPMLTLRPPLLQTYTPEELALRSQSLFRRLLLPYDNSESAQYLLTQVKKLVETASIKSIETCVLTQLVPTGSRFKSEQEALEQAETICTTAQSQLEALGVQAPIEVRVGEGPSELFKVASEYGVSAIALSSHKANKLLELSVPSFGGEVLRQSWHPVLFFPG